MFDRDRLMKLLIKAWTVIHADERGLTTLEYVIAAAIIIVVLAAALLAWNNGLAAKIAEIIRSLQGTPG